MRAHLRHLSHARRQLQLVAQQQHIRDCQQRAGPIRVLQQPQAAGRYCATDSTVDACRRVGTHARGGGGGPRRMRADSCQPDAAAAARTWSMMETRRPEKLMVLTL